MMNEVLLHGRLTADPVLRQTQSGTFVASFTLAVGRDYQTEGGQAADFINCIAWKATGEFISKYFFKGQEMIAKGSLQQRSYTGKDGKKQYITEVNISKVDFCGSKKAFEDKEISDEPPATFKKDSQYEVLQQTEIEDDLPF